jgi:Peptidase family M23
MKYKITSKYGDIEKFRIKPHTGVDFKMEDGEPIYAIKSGLIHLKDFGDFNAGKTIIIQSRHGEKFIFGHLSEFKVKEGQFVKKGDLIGLSGNTGHSTGSHLHFGVKDSSNHFIDPSPYIDHIQNMNTPHWLANHVGSVKEKSFSFSDWFNQDIYSSFMEIKLNLINLFTSIDYTFLMENIQNMFKFFSG